MKNKVYIYALKYTHCLDGGVSLANYEITWHLNYSILRPVVLTCFPRRITIWYMFCSLVALGPKMGCVYTLSSEHLSWRLLIVAESKYSCNKFMSAKLYILWGSCTYKCMNRETINIAHISTWSVCVEVCPLLLISNLVQLCIQRNILVASASRRNPN